MQIIDIHRFCLRFDTSFTCWTFGFIWGGDGGVDIYLGPLSFEFYWGELWDR